MLLLYVKSGTIVATTGDGTRVVIMYNSSSRLSSRSSTRKRDDTMPPKYRRFVDGGSADDNADDAEGHEPSIADQVYELSSALARLRLRSAANTDSLRAVAEVICVCV